MCAVTTPYDVVRKHAETIPDQTALTFGDAHWTYADLAEQAGRVAGGLRDIGLGRGDRLAALAGNRPEVALAWLAGSRSGVQPCLLNNRLTAPRARSAARPAAAASAAGRPGTPPARDRGLRAC
jgi:acyl-CoA synthetase (AMP-forming)/AMP-acid ligase II